MKDNKEFVIMMEGGVGRFSVYEVWFLLTNLNELGINTLKVQQNIDGTYCCIVDDFTIRKYESEAC
jgi:hypothetical protein